MLFQEEEEVEEEKEEEKEGGGESIATTTAAAEMNTFVVAPFLSVKPDLFLIDDIFTDSSSKRVETS